MISNCEKCKLPILVSQIDSYKITVSIANANISSSSSPTEAEPYLKAAEDAVAGLRDATTSYQEFIKIWDGFCSHCKFGV